MVHRPFLVSMSSCSGCHAVPVFLDSGFWSRCCLVQCNEDIKPPFDWWQGSSLYGQEYSTSGRGMLVCPSSWHGGVLTHYTPHAWSCCDPVLWVVALILGFTICWHLRAMMSFPQPNACVPSNIYSHITLPEVFTHLQWMLQWTSTVEVITSH